MQWMWCSFNLQTRKSIMKAFEVVNTCTHLCSVSIPSWQNVCFLLLLLLLLLQRTRRYLVSGI
jgi:hypothetical protein